MIRKLVINLSDVVQESLKGEVEYATDATKRDTFEQEPFDKLSGRVVNALRLSDELARAIEALKVLFAIMSVTILFDMR